MKSGLLSLVLPDDRVRKITRPCPFCTCKYELTRGFFGLCSPTQFFLPSERHTSNAFDLSYTKILSADKSFV